MFKLKTPRRESKYKVTIRSVVLETVNGRLEMRMARDIALDARIPYRQAVDALDRLYNMGKVHRDGRKFSAKWGPLALKEKQAASRHAEAAFMDSVFRKFCRR